MLDQLSKSEIDRIQKNAENKNRYDDNDRRIPNFLKSGPCYFSNFCVYFHKECFDSDPNIFDSFHALQQFIRHNQLSRIFHRSTTFLVTQHFSEAGQEGFEPPSSGFGDRRSSRWSYWPVPDKIPLLHFFVQSMMTAPGTVFFSL
jgi:hypothetical protein